MAHNAYLFTVTPSIPKNLMTELERKFLCHVLEYEEDGDAIYFFSEESPNEWFYISPNVEKLIESDKTDLGKHLHDVIVNQYADEESDDYDIEHNFDYTNVFQQIVARHKDELPFVVVEGCWWCSKMRPGEFGGFATMILPDEIKSIDTASWIALNLPRDSANEAAR
jgi:hypothetical protein